MPSHRKELVRARMEKTGESYQQALRHVRAQGERAPSAPFHEQFITFCEKVVKQLRAILI